MERNQQEIEGACMTSPLSSALARLDDILATVHSQVARLRAALEVSDDQLSHSLLDARRQMATLRDLIRAERPDANWNDRRTLECLIDELETAAKVRRNQQRRTKLEELANELQVGRVKHRFGTRTSALNKLRMDSVEELRTEATVSDPVKDLPGPSASAWLHWACNLQDANDALDLTNLRKDFKAVERFAGEMEECYWVPGERTFDSPSEPSEQSVQPEQEKIRD
jgi:hypothetical protein